MHLSSCLLFFFSSRRRHTRFDCDWSSDVCSSDLAEQRVPDLVDRDVEAVEPAVALGVEREHDPIHRQERGQGEAQAALYEFLYANTSSATSTRPNGALTCTPCTAPFTCRNISRAIATPSASAASFPRSLAFRMRASTSSRTDTPGTSFARNSALRSDNSGQIPPTTGILNGPTRCRNSSSCRTSNTGCVTANSAPASTFQAKRDSSRSRSMAPGFTPTPITQRVG